MSHRQPQLIWRLVEESLSEAAFLWGRLDRALAAADHTLEDAERWVQERLSGALDGVRLAAAAAEPLLAAALTDRDASDAGYVSVAIYLLATLGTPNATRVLEEQLRVLSPEQSSAVVSGLRRTTDARLLHELHSRLAGEAPIAEAALIEALSDRGEPIDLDWRVYLTADDPALRRAAAGALGQLSASQRSEVMWMALQSADPEVHTRAVSASVLAGDASAWRHCIERLRTPDETSGPLLCLAAMLGASAEHALVIKAMARPELTAAALWALSFAGTRDAVDVCVAHSHGDGAAAALGTIGATEALVALEAIDWVTGTDNRPPWCGRGQVGQVGRVDQVDQVSQLDQLDQVVPLPGSEQPRGGHAGQPRTETVQAWWSRERERFDPSRRYQQGKPATLASLRHALASGPAHRRHAVAAELSARTRSAHRVQSWAFCWQQRQQLARLSALEPRELREAARAAGFAALEEVACSS